MRLLVQSQLSNYDDNGNYILECDSGFQMMTGRLIEMLKLDSKLQVDMTVPENHQTVTRPEDITRDYPGFDRVTFLRQDLTNHAIKTRFDFPWDDTERMLRTTGKEYTHVLINDPMQMRNYKALFARSFGTKPKIVTHSHFIDNPESPKVPDDVTYWYGQMEAAIRSDWNFWQCESAMNIFFDSFGRYYNADIVQRVREKSEPWDDGYSSTEINMPIDYSRLRFRLLKDKVVVFVPNRVGRSFDYTNNGKFLFDIVNTLADRRHDFVVVAGNPSQKVSNDELAKSCKPYIKLVDGTFTRNEYRYVARQSHIVVGLYDNDSYGGTAWRECIDLGCLPLSLDIFEYKRFFDRTQYPFKVRTDFSDTNEQLSKLIDYAKRTAYRDGEGTVRVPDYWFKGLIKQTCSFEATTPSKLERMIKL